MMIIKLMSLRLSLQLKYVISTYILHRIRVLTNSKRDEFPLSWLDSSVGRALHRYRSGRGFESRLRLNYIYFSSFTITAAYIVAAIIIHVFTCITTAVGNAGCDFMVCWFCEKNPYSISN